MLLDDIEHSDRRRILHRLPEEGRPRVDRLRKEPHFMDGGVRARHFDRCFTVVHSNFMPPGTAEEDRSPPRSENQGFRRNYFSFFGNPLTPNSSKFEISPKFCEAFFNPVKFRQIFIKICSKTSEIESKFAKNDEI